MRHTLIDWIETERTIRAGSQGGGNKSTLKAKQPGEQVAKPPTGLTPVQQPEPLVKPLQQAPNPQAPPMNPALAPPVQMQPMQNVGPYPPTPQARVMPGQSAPRTPGVPNYPGGGGSETAPPSASTPKPWSDKAAKKAGGKPPDPKGQTMPGTEEDEEQQLPNSQDAQQQPGGPGANHVANHVQDPLGSTHQMFQNLGQKQLEYEMEKENARRSLAPVKAVLQHVDQLHQLTPQQPMGMDESMGYQDPNNPQQQQPGMGGKPGMPGQMGPNGPQPGQLGNKPPAMGGQVPGATPNTAGSGGPGMPGKPNAGAAPGSPGDGTGTEQPGKPGGKGAPAKGKGGKKISMTVEGAYDPYRMRKPQSLRSMLDGADLNVVKR